MSSQDDNEEPLEKEKEKEKDGKHLQHKSKSYVETLSSNENRSHSFSYDAYVQNYHQQSCFHRQSSYSFSKAKCNAAGREGSSSSIHISYKQLPPPLSSSTYRAKVKKLFPDVAVALRSQLLLDDVAIYSATDQRTADIMSNIILQYTPASSTIVDATASSAGNTLSFAKFFDRVIAIERNPCRFENLKHNARVMGKENIHFICADSLNVLLPSKFRPGTAVVHPTFPLSAYRHSEAPLDVIFMDPPWGGPAYRRSPKISLFISQVPLACIIKELANNQVARIVAIKVPNNFDMTEFVKEAAISISTEHGITHQSRESAREEKNEHYYELISSHALENMKMIVLVLRHEKM